MDNLRKDIHNLSINGRAKFPCDVCGKMFVKEANMKIHKRTHLIDWSPPFKCEDCGQLFKSRRHLLLHNKQRSTASSPQQVHSTDAESDEVASQNPRRSFKCDMCGRLFAKESGLAMHKRRHASPQPEKSHMENKNEDDAVGPRKTDDRAISKSRHGCDVCGKVFLLPRNLKLHVKQHAEYGVESKKSFECDVCGKLFGSAVRLRTHKQKHLDGQSDQPHKCEHCPRSFLTLATLVVHQRLHHADEEMETKPSTSKDSGKYSTETRFKCNTCGRTYKNQRNMERHVKEHH